MLYISVYQNLCVECAGARMERYYMFSKRTTFMLLRKY